MQSEGQNEPRGKSKSGISRTSILLILPVILLAGVAMLVSKPAPLFGEQAPAAAQPAAPAVDTSMFTADQKGAIGQIVKDYLIAHPEIIVEVQGALEAKMAKEEAQRTRKLVSQLSKEIYRSPNAPTAGNPNGDITVVEFFDYNCGYCKRGFADVAKLVESDPKVRVVFKEFPILSKDSEEASKVALAARKQGKYWEIHKALIESKGKVGESAALKAAEGLGLDMAKLKADKDSAEVTGELASVQELAKKMGINGTPHFLVGDQAIGGAPEHLFELLTSQVAELRKTGCAYC